MHPCCQMVLEIERDTSVLQQHPSVSSSLHFPLNRRVSERSKEPISKMTTIHRFYCNDLLCFASVNLEHLTETFNMSFYMTYLVRWPDYFHVAEGPKTESWVRLSTMLGKRRGRKEGKSGTDNVWRKMVDEGG
ncbi:hypothetical protein PIB30_080615 [Stylosanthes scabra]|uniref:Uncharacterized protein n=1 Tax=Stylosanthes scabra TaxID=79078 RepID=A0ABU6ZQ79_9FABA|nr:hypothetical protein [Stylosanthes scabra]